MAKAGVETVFKIFSYTARESKCPVVMVKSWSLLLFLRAVFAIPPGDSGSQFNMPSVGNTELRREYKSNSNLWGFLSTGYDFFSE